MRSSCIRATGWRQRIVLSSRTYLFALATLVTLFVASPAWAWDPFITSNSDVDEGNEAFAAGSYDEALEAYLAAKEYLPESPELHYDTGTALLAKGDVAEAIKELSRALEGAPKILVPQIRYNLGLAYATKASALEGDTAALEDATMLWGKAVAEFEKVLSVVPDHQGALTNLEVALMRVDPPCSARDDDLEPNEGPEQASPITFDPTTGTFEQDLLLCEATADWLTIPLKEHDRLFATISSEGDAKATMTLYAPDGATEIIPGTTDEAVLLDTPAAGDYKLAVTSTAEADIDYSLELKVTPSCDSLEDTQEDNDTPGEARELSPGTLPGLRHCPGDDDWFAVLVEEGQSLVAVVTTKEPLPGLPEEAAPSLVVVDENEQEVATGGGGGGTLMAVLLAPPPGIYRIGISGVAEWEATYDLTITLLPPCPEGNDELEPNDSPEQSSVLQWPTAEQGGPMGAATGQPGGPTPGQPGPPGAQGQAPQEQVITKLLRICGGDDDWLGVTIPAETPVSARIIFDHDKGDLVLSATEEDGKKSIGESDVSTEDLGVEAVGFPVAEEETPYLLHVQGADPSTENFYLLVVKAEQGNGGGGGGGNDKDESQNDDQSQGDDKQNDQQDDQQDEQSQQDDQQQQDQQQDEQKSPMEDQIEKMDKNPKNLEAEKAKQRAPYRYSNPEKDW